MFLRVWYQKRSKVLYEKGGGAIGFFSKSADIGKYLERLYVPMFEAFMGMPPAQARSTFHDLLEMAKEESQEEGLSNLPKNFGDTLLKEEAKDEKIKKMLAKKRKEGVRNEDIRWWWNLHDLERRILLKVDELHAMAMFMDGCEKGMERIDAVARVGRFHPIYGDPDDKSHLSGNDRPLPYELMDRVNIYIQERAKADPEQYKREIERSSSFNALIRKEIKKGNI